MERVFTPHSLLQAVWPYNEHEMENVHIGIKTGIYRELNDVRRGNEDPSGSSAWVLEVTQIP